MGAKFDTTFKFSLIVDQKSVLMDKIMDLGEGFKIPTSKIPTIIIRSVRDFSCICKNYNWVCWDFNWGF